MLMVLAVAAMVCAVGPTVMFCLNLRDYVPPPLAGDVTLPRVSVLIPARNEEAAIGAAIEAVLASRGVAFEVVVMDDASTDATAAIVSEMATREERVRLVEAPRLPAGWNGKQHACLALAGAARHEVLCFVDADVRLEPEALERMVNFLQRSGSGLVSGFPRQVTVTWMEWMLLPLIHFVLLGFLPLRRMRGGTDPAFAAGCGQFLMMDRAAYEATGGHAAIRATMHDGLLLPRLLRRHGFCTDLADLTSLARCRMYTDARQVWLGLAKNATEGIAAPARIVPISTVLLLGQVVPFALATWLMAHHTSAGVQACVLVATCAAWLPRILAVVRFQQDWRGALLHPLTILLLLAVQWYALLRKLRGGAVSWKDRAYAEEQT